MKRSLKVEAAGDFHAGRIIPKLRLSGRWLQAAGFHPDTRVTVHVETGRLTIQPERSQIPPNSGDLEAHKTRVISRITAALQNVQQTSES